MSVGGFFLLLTALLMLPFVPGVAELWRKRDARPLAVAPNYDVDVHHFARTFQSYVDAHFARHLQNAAPQATRQGKLEDGSRYRLLGARDAVVFEDEERVAQVTTRMFIARGRLDLPGAMSYLNEIYAGGGITGASESIYRALLGAEDIELGENSMLLRWMHAPGDVRVGAGCVLHGRVSADHEIRIAARSRFERLHAPRILFGENAPTVPEREPREELSPEDLPQFVEVAGGRWLVEQNLTVPDDARIDANLVVVGKLTLGRNVEINGSIKSHRRMRIGEGCDLHGSVVCMKNIDVGPFAALKGPLVSEAAIAVAANCRIGAAARPTTVTAEGIEVEPDCVAHGTVWARSAGEVL